MRKKSFTPEEQEILRQNQYTYKVTEYTIAFTKEFKELFAAKYKEGLTARNILTDCGYNTEIFGDRRVQGISHHIRKQYEETGGIFTEGHTSCRKPRIPPAQLSEKEELKQLRQEVDYLKQEIEFLKKISSIRTTRK